MATDPRTIQLWPGGSSVTYRELDNEQFEVKAGDEWIPATPEQYRAIRIEEIAEHLAERDVLCCDSSLVDDLLKAADELPPGMNGSEWQWDNVSNLIPDPSDWDLEQCREFLDEHGIDNPGDNPWEEFAEPQEVRDHLLDLMGVEDKEEREGYANVPLEELRKDAIQAIEADVIDEWREAVRDNAESAEIYEWYRVTKYLANRLDEIGECVLSNSYGEWWGRCATGQALIMDGVLQQVAASILDK